MYHHPHPKKPPPHPVVTTMSKREWIRSHFEGSRRWIANHFWTSVIIVLAIVGFIRWVF
jgi:hypothetical protein